MPILSVSLDFATLNSQQAALGLRYAVGKWASLICRFYSAVPMSYDPPLLDKWYLFSPHPKLG